MRSLKSEITHSCKLPPRAFLAISGAEQGGCMSPCWGADLWRSRVPGWLDPWVLSWTGAVLTLDRWVLRGPCGPKLDCSTQQVPLLGLPAAQPPM